MDGPDAGHPHGESVPERGLPSVMVHHGRDAAQQVLERAEQERIRPVESPAARHFVGPACVQVHPPRVRVGVRWGPEAWIMVAVQVVMGVEEAGPELPRSEVD